MSVLPTKDDAEYRLLDPSRRSRTRRVLVFGTLFAAAGASLLLYSTRPAPSFNAILSAPEPHSALPGVCADTKPLHGSAPAKNVWQNFDVQEAVAIREWLGAYKDEDGKGFNFVPGLAATDRDNVITVIENFPPTKAEVLAHLDGDGPAPQRFAKIILTLGAASPPAIKPYLLGPLPETISSLTLNAAQVKLEPLTHIYTRPEIPFTARLTASNSSLTGKFILNLMAPLQNATLDLLGGTIKGIPWGSPSPSVGKENLVFGGSTPFSYDGSFRRMWLQLKKNVPGSWLYALDMYFYVDFTSMDPDEWYLISMVYNRQVFSSVSEFMDAYNNGTLKRSKHPDPPVDEPWAARDRRGTPRDLDERAGPRQVSFNGPRFRVDEANQWVSWMGWAFYISFARDMGLSLWDVRFRGERILYEIAPQEALAVYSGSDPHQSSTVFMDGGFGMGTATRSVILGYDCPHEAHLLPAITHTDVGTLVRRDAICVFERDSGRPLSRHTGYMKNEMGAIKGYELVVRTISTVGNYDYLFDYTFQLDGTIEVRISASGYLQGAWWDDAEHDYGTKIRETYMGSLHDHVINYKLDFDIAGTRNSFMKITLENEVVQQPWFADDWGQDVSQQKIVREIVKTEDDTLLDYPRNLEAAYVVLNQEELNKWGNPRGYAIHPGMSPIHLTNLNNKRTEKNMNFAKQHIGVTRRKETELSSSSMWNINLPGDPPTHFYDYFDGESIEQEDLTAWVNLGMHHIPRAEDSPMTLTNIATSSVLLTPFNFNDFDPAMESMNAIIIGVPEPGAAWSADENGVESAYCVPPPVKKFEYPGLFTFEDDGTPARAARVHEMRQQAESYHAIFAASDL
ncbi:Amine oxidase catalytic domain-containing protein [Mycena chlorophos]|uniref:Amine oxidase n=1 Tax=Mycena chlorophos TaxID=658473 RepID=A0A8H6S1L8_MYCCL|nr:Amine oxidase catalytic domain-containing protein [Mycena chlorophos]